MAVKAIGMIKAFNLESNGDLNLYLDIFHAQNQVHDLYYGPVDPSITDITLNSDLLAFIKDYAETEWSIEFGLFDTVRLIHKVSAL